MVKRKSVKSVVVLLALMVSYPSFSQDNEPQPLVSFEMVRTGSTVSVLLRPTSDEVFIPACHI